MSGGGCERERGRARAWSLSPLRRLLTLPDLGARPPVLSGSGLGGRGKADSAAPRAGAAEQPKRPQVFSERNRLFPGH